MSMVSSTRTSLVLLWVTPRYSSWYHIIQHSKEIYYGNGLAGPVESFRLDLARSILTQAPTTPIPNKIVKLISSYLSQRCVIQWSNLLTQISKSSVQPWDLCPSSYTLITSQPHRTTVSSTAFMPMTRPSSPPPDPHK